MNRVKTIFYGLLCFIFVLPFHLWYCIKYRDVAKALNENIIFNKRSFQTMTEYLVLYCIPFRELYSKYCGY